MGLQAKTEDDLLAEARDCDAIMNQYARVGAKTIAVMETCKVIARYGVGVDIVDVAAATARGILVTNVRDYCTEEVADHAMALWLSLARGLAAYDRATHQGDWRWQSAAPLHRIRGQTMGIISFGKIGQAIAHRARAFGARILVYDPYLSAEQIAALGAAQGRARRNCWPSSDAVMMQVPMTGETRHFLGPREFAAHQAGCHRHQYRSRAHHRQPGALRCAGVGQGRGGGPRRPGGGTRQAGAVEPVGQSAVLACPTSS